MHCWLVAELVSSRPDFTRSLGLVQHLLRMCVCVQKHGAGGIEDGSAAMQGSFGRRNAYWILRFTD